MRAFNGQAGGGGHGGYYQSIVPLVDPSGRIRSLSEVRGEAARGVPLTNWSVLATRRIRINQMKFRLYWIHREAAYIGWCTVASLPQYGRLIAAEPCHSNVARLYPTATPLPPSHGE